jgi:hypothetical protein
MRSLQRPFERVKSVRGVGSSPIWRLAARVEVKVIGAKRLKLARVVL